MKKLLTFLTMFTLFFGVGWASTTVSKTIAAIAEANNWANSTQYTSFNLDDNITVRAEGGGNTGKYYTNGYNWRLYQNEDPTLSVIAADGYTIISITVTYSPNSGGVLVYNNSKLSSPATVSVSGSTIVFEVGNSGTATNGQVRVTEISVTYESGGTPQPGPDAPEGTISFNPAAGEVNMGTPVAMSFSGTCDGIKYTLDESSPSATNGTVYDASNPPVINAATTIKAAAYNYLNNQYAFGTEATAAYTVIIPEVEYDGTATFVAGTDVGTITAYNESEATPDQIVKEPVTFYCTNAALNAPQANNVYSYRLFKNSTTTFSVPDGYKITKIEFAGPGGNQAITGFASMAGLTTTETSGLWIGEEQSVSFEASVNQVRCTQIKVYYTEPEAPQPTADGYYIVGSFTNNWTRMDEWKLQQQSDGSYTLNNVEIPQYAQFKIVKVDGATVRWCGGAGGYTLDGQTVTAIDGASHANLPVWIDPDEDKGSNYYMLVGGMSNVKLAPGNLLTVNPVTVYYKKIDPANGNVLETVEMTPTATGWTINRTGIQVDDQFGFSDNWGVWHGGKQQDNNWAQIWEAQLGQPIYMSNDGNFIIKIAGDFNLSVNSDLNQMTADLIPQNYNLTCTAVSDVEGKTGGSIVVKVDGNTVQATEGVYSILSGKEVTLEITPNGGYNFNNVTLDGAALTATLNNEGKYIATFTMPRADAAVQANFTGIPYTITVTNDPEEGGTVTGLPAQAYAGQEGISFTVTPNDGYVVVGVEVTPSYVQLTENEGTYTFNMPAADVAIAVTFRVPTPPTGGGDYVKVTSTTDLTDGEYLIVYKGDENHNAVAFNGALSSQNVEENPFDVTGNGVAVEIYDDGTIPSSQAVDAAIFTIDLTARTIKSASGYYIGRTANSNGLNSSTETVYTNTISVDENGNAVIKCEGNTYLRYNYASNQLRFRYYGSGQQSIALYKKIEQPEEVTLAELMTNGVQGNTYQVTDLICVKKLDAASIILCKDDDNSIIRDVNVNNYAEEITFGHTDNGAPIVLDAANYDQSNWIVLKTDELSTGEAAALPENMEGYKLTNVIGTLTGANELTLSCAPATGDASAYTPNTFYVASFNGSNTQTATWMEYWSGNEEGVQNSQECFFVQPKPLELVKVIYAQWDGSKFTTPTSEVYNQFHFKGSFALDGAADGLEPGSVYTINGYVNVTTSKAGGFSITPTEPIVPQTTVITAVEDLNMTVNGEVESVTYFNVSGMKSSKPFDGINIVVTRYTDGHTSTKKIVK